MKIPTSVTTSLHVNNVANVAYGNAKILRRHGQLARVACHDIRHLMSQPEWDDLELNPEDFPDETDFHANKACFGDYVRPSWFSSEFLLPATTQGSRFPVELLKRAGRRLPSSFRLRLERAYYKISNAAMKSRPGAVAGTGADPATELRIIQLAEKAEAFGEEWRIDKHALRRHGEQSRWLARQSGDVDVVFAYYLSPVYAMLCGGKPLVSVDIGTMREMPPQSSSLAQLMWLAYRLSDHVLLTNPDNRELAERRGIHHISFCPHPVDQSVFYPGTDQALRNELLQAFDADYLLLAPARQNWKIKGNDKFIHAFSRLLKSGIKAALIIPAWGQEVERSRSLARALKLEAHIHWQKPMSEPLLARYYRAVDLVLDQFQLGVFGLITPKAMACGKPVLTSYEPRHNAWCFPVPPPVLPCHEADAIFEAMRSLLQNHSLRQEIGAASHAWVTHHHSEERVVTCLNDAMRLATERFRTQGEAA